MIFLLSIFIQAPSAISQGSVKFSFGDITHQKLDEDNDGLYEYLVLKVELNIFEPGLYGLHGDLGYGITANNGPLEMDIGENILELRFSGGAVARSFIVGTMTVDIEAYSRDTQVGSRKITYSPGEVLEPKEFEPPAGGMGTEVRIIGQEVVLESPKMEVRMNMSSPELTFSYPGEVGQDKSSTVKYLEIIAFNDLDDDGIWDPGTDELKYSADLDDVVWELETDFTRGYDISLFGVIQLRLAGTSTVAGWARMTFGLSSEYMTLEPPSQKFDIDLDLWQQLDADHISVRHVFSDDSGRFQLVQGTDEETGDSTITVMKDGKRAYGTYSWTEQIEVGELIPEEASRAVTWLEIDGSSASVWFSYPVGNSTRLIHHDPRVSMDPKVPQTEETDDFLGNSPLVMILGTMAGLLIVGGTLFLRKYKQKVYKDLDRGGGS